MNQQYPSILLEKAVGEFAKLPGVGRKTAMRLVLHLLRQDTATVEAFGNAIITLKHEVKYCKICHNISDTETCCICSNPVRDASTICVVETIRDVMAVEATQQYKGLYHVLGGVISPMDGIGPSDLQIESLVERVKNNEVKEVILALSSTMEGDTTNFYIFRKLADTNAVTVQRHFKCKVIINRILLDGLHKEARTDDVRRAFCGGGVLVGRQQR